MSESRPLEGVRVIVTGASRGLGRAIAIACAASGATVGVNFNRSEADARHTADRLGPNGILLNFDVQDPAAVAAGVQAFVERTGGLDALVNNAAIVRPSLLVSASDEDIDAVIRTNVTGLIACTRAALAPMLRQRRGVILNVSSVAAGRPSKGQAVYAATKGAVEAFTRAVAVEYGRKGLRCACISPGPMDTEMFAATKALGGEDVLARTPWTHFVAVEDVAALAVRLLAGGTGAVNGAVHTIDGSAPNGLARNGATG
jgi:3-oxoacyl-[acyl-carrier protein] reductase